MRSSLSTFKICFTVTLCFKRQLLKIIIHMYSCGCIEHLAVESLPKTMPIESLRQGRKNKILQELDSCEVNQCVPMESMGQCQKSKILQEQDSREVNQYEEWRNEKVLENKKKMLELFPELQGPSHLPKVKVPQTLTSPYSKHIYTTKAK